MTLYQMSYVYREDALRFRMRITVLREQARTAEGEDKLRLRYEENMTVSEIAEAIGRDKSTVSRTLSRARRRLYKCLRYGL